MEQLLLSPAFQSHLVLALAGLTSAYVAIARPTLSPRCRASPSSSSAAAAAVVDGSDPPTHGSSAAAAAGGGAGGGSDSGGPGGAGRSSSDVGDSGGGGGGSAVRGGDGGGGGGGGREGTGSAAATLWEAGSSPFVACGWLAAARGCLAVYIFALGAVQVARLGPYTFKFYTIWNWWLLGIYFALAALASAACARAEAGASAAEEDGGAKAATAGGGAAASANGRAGAAAAAAVSDPRPQPGGGGDAATGGSHSDLRGLRSRRRLQSAGVLSRACHGLFMVNASTVIIVDAVCWGLLYPMLTRGPQTPEIERIIRRLLLTWTSYNQHGLNAVFISADLLLNRHRLSFESVGHLGLWSLAYALWAHGWHAATGKWLYPFLDTSKPWAPVAYFGLYLVHWLAFGLVAALYRLKHALHSRAGAAAAAASGAAGGKVAGGSSGKAGKAD